MLEQSIYDVISANIQQGTGADNPDANRLKESAESAIV